MNSDRNQNSPQTDDISSTDAQTIRHINPWYLLERSHKIESLVIRDCSIAITSDGLNLAIPAKKQGETSIRNLQTGQQHRVLLGSSYAFVTAITISADNTLMACITTSELSVWEFDTGRKIASFYQAKSGVHPEQTCQSLVFSTDNRYLIVGEKDNRKSDNGTTTADIVVWDMQTKTECYRLLGSSMNSSKPVGSFWLGGMRNAVNDMALSPDGKWLVSGWEDGTLSVWDWQNRQKLHNTQMNHETTEGYSSMEDGISYPATRRFNAPIYAVAITPDGTKIVSAGDKAKIKVWNLQNGGLISDLTETQCELGIFAIAISHDSKTLFTGDRAGIVKIWDLETSELQHSFQAHTKAVRSIAVSPYGRTIVTASEDQTVQIWSNHNWIADRSTDG
jgi:WD40 repeat protein